MAQKCKKRAKKRKKFQKVDRKKKKTKKNLAKKKPPPPPDEKVANEKTRKSSKLNFRVKTRKKTTKISYSYGLATKKSRNKEFLS